MQQPDLLFMIFDSGLRETHNLNETANDFIHRISTTYILRLMGQGHMIPEPLFDSVVEEVQETVLELYRKKTYGHLTLKSYRKTTFSSIQK